MIDSTAGSDTEVRLVGSCDRNVKLGNAIQSHVRPAEMALKSWWKVRPKGGHAGRAGVDLELVHDQEQDEISWNLYIESESSPR